MRILQEDGLSWIMDDEIRTDLITQAHEPDLFQMGSGKVFLDIGAHVGKYALRASRTFEQVYAVEPSSDVLRCLRANIALNGIENVEVLPFGAWSSSGFVDMGGANCNASAFRGGVQIHLPVRALDELNLTPDLIKLDVEGAEVHALAGMTQTILRHHPRLFIENHDHLFPNENISANLRRILEEFGYGIAEIPWEAGNALYWDCR